MGFVLRLLGGAGGPWILLGLVAAIVGSGLYIRSTGYKDGIRDERQTWQKVAQKARDDAQALAHERQARVDDAASARAERDRLYAQRSIPIQLEVQNYAKTPAAAVRCIDTNGVRIGQSAIDAANAAIAAPTR